MKGNDKRPFGGRINPNVKKGFGVRFGSVHKQKPIHFLPMKTKYATNENIIKRNIEALKAGLLLQNMKSLRDL